MTSMTGTTATGPFAILAHVTEECEDLHCSADGPCADCSDAFFDAELDILAERERENRMGW